MDTSSPTFCVLPFIHKHQRLSGDETVCCCSKVPINKAGYLTTHEVQQKLLAGEQISNCQECWNYEKNNIQSHRLRENQRWLADVDIQSYLKTYNIGDELKTFSYDLRNSNTCNLSCIGCSPQQSSLWAKELNIDYPAVASKYDTEEVSRAKWIYLAGGEPFLSPKMLELLEYVSKKDKQPAICINTNLTIQDDDFKEICRNLKHLTLNVSIDGIDKIAEYHRYPINWNKFKRNLEWAKTLNCDIVFQTLVDAVNVMFINDIMKYEDYPIRWALTLLYIPVPLEVQNLPEHLKQEAYDNFIKLRTSKFYKDPSFKNNVESIAQKILKPGDPSLLASRIKELDNRRNINHIEYLGIKLS